ncbi:probable serine/threonine-protein kinase nek3 [Tribolium madens]|uniref:probable serine/threonine-protein kinase nek3 n=1 Tax=Tribolium madens TaxID=41895 RepID=UPI001CF7367D|nr:probable serine/threonine-protein kinase nek3 [Tribolium madens]
MPRESSKCREWEKERRNRLNEAFATLCKLLPCYDPATNLSKIDILRNATTYIEELQVKIKTFISKDDDEPAKKLKNDEFKKLQERIKKLLSKNEQLCTLLREAKIPIPPGCSLRKFKPPFLWCNKIMPEQAKLLQKKELDKENDASAKKPQGRKFTNKNRNKGGQNSTPKHRKAILNRSDPKKLRPSKKKKIKPIATSKCVIVLSQPNATQPCYIITNAPSNNILGGSSTVITNSTLVANPLVSSKATKTVSSIPSLGPGTLILANGTIMPVLPQQTVLPQIITRPPPIILVPRNPITTTSTPTTSTQSVKTASSTTTSVKTLTRIKPKYCLTRTTQVNKVPIPALTSRYSNPEVVLKKNEPKVKAKPVEKKVTKENEEKRKVPTPDENSTETKKAKVDENKEKEKEVEKEPPETQEVQTKNVEEEEKRKEPEEKPEEPEKPSEPKKPEETLELNINSELSNDIFASLQVPAGCQNPESTSPTAAFLLAFPLVSSLTGVKVTEVTEEDNTESQRGTPTLLQIGTMDTTKPTQSESLTPSLLNLDNLSFFSSKDIGGFYNSFEPTTTTVPITTVTSSVSKEEKKLEYTQPKNQLVPYYDNRNSVPIPTFCSTNSTNSSYQQKPKNVETKQTACSNYNAQKMFSCNSFETPKVTTTCSYANQIKSYPEPLYTNSTTYTYSNTSDTSFNQNCYKELPKTDNRSYYSLNYENYSDYRKNDSGNTYFPTSNYYSNGQKFGTNNTTNAQKPKSVPQSRPPINWMTTPDNRTPSDYVLPQFTTKESDFAHNSIYPCNTFTNTQTTYFNTNPMYSNTNDGSNAQETRKSLDLPIYQRNEIEENQFSWSPSKIPQFLDPPHSFVSSTLPTLVGDLALGNPPTFGEQKAKKRVKYEGNQNFLSVSQLVDHNKEVPARTTTRRNSGNRGSSAKKLPQKAPPHRKDKEVYPAKVDKGMKQVGYSSDLFCDATKNRKNSYSAEALIGHQMQGDGGHKNRQNYNNKAISVSSFLHDNIIPYFPTVDLPQDNSYMQQNQNYQSTSFTHNSFIPSTTTYNFMHDVPTHDYSENLALFPPVTKDKNCKIVNRNVREQQCPTTPKKSKRKHSNEGNLPGFVDFPFLSMPGSINSPILPDDFHTHSGFLQPPTPQLYPCKNPFTKSNDLGSSALLPLPPVPGTRSNIQHPEISPSINSAGTSLTNFNLCTIFPEMNNKSALPDPYAGKDHTRSYSSSVQVTFNDKPTFSFSYINTTSQSYNNQ